MPDETPDLSLVIACFNEGERLRDSVARLVEACRQLVALAALRRSRRLEAGGALSLPVETSK